MNRNYSIDFLRGAAIIGMVLSAVFPWTSDFPGWMYHAQVGPPDFKFNPDNPGITWVDLVFPFFLFAMGAAFPLALKSKLDNKQYFKIGTGLLRRGVLLTFFAIALAYLTPHNLKGENWVVFLTSLLSFFAFFLVFLRFEGGWPKRYGLQILGFLLIGVLIYLQHAVLGNEFDLYKSDIIILILANMAVFGSVFWLLTAESFTARLAVLAGFAGIWLTKDIEGSWTSVVWNFHPDLQWFYNFSFLKYLCIVLPGSILGDLLLQNREVANNNYTDREKLNAGLLAVLSFAFLVFHLTTLYMRLLSFNLFGHIVFGVLFLLFFVKSNQAIFGFYKTLIVWGFVLITVALCFEPMDGGIKKDPSSFSYWFLTSGLAFVFYIVCDYLTKTKPQNLFVSSVVKNGQNPMLAYCVSAFYITPVLGLLQILPWFDQLSSMSPYLGLIRTIVYVFLMVLITNYATNRKWFWRS